MSVERSGYVGLFQERLDRGKIEETVLLWISRFGAVEQATGNAYQISTQAVRKASDIVWNQSLEFRVLSGEQSTWIYITPGTHVVETTGLVPEGGSTLCRDVLTDIPACIEIINERNERRLDELEAQGLM